MIPTRVINKLDTYILRKFFVILGFTILGWIVLFIIIDMVENLDDFLSNSATKWQIIRYYLMYIPFASILTMPISVLISVLFSMGMMAQFNEIIAMQSSGVSLYRIMSWLLVSGFLISLLVGISGETFVPDLNRRRLDFMRYDIQKKARYSQSARSNVVIKDDQNIIAHIGYYNGKNETATSVTLIWLDSLKNIETRLDAQKMRWDKENQEWKLNKVIQRKFSSVEQISELDSMEYRPQFMYPGSLIELRIKPEEMTLRELVQFIRRLKSMGLSPHKWQTDLHMKIAYPLANFIVLLIGAPLAARKRRSGVALGMVIAFVVSFAYFIFVRVGQVLGHKGVIDPVTAAWMGNVVFLVIGLVVLLRIRK